MKMATKAVALWPGVHAVEATITRHAEQIDVTSYGSPTKQFVSGPVHESVRLGIMCDVATYELLTAMLQSPVEFDPTSEHFTVRVASKHAANVPPPTVTHELKEAPFRLITLE